MSPPMFRAPECECPSLAERMRDTIAEVDVPLCPVHQADELAARKADDERARHHADADLLAAAYGLRRPSDPEPPGPDPFLAALAAKVGSQTALNSPALETGLAAALGGTVADPRTFDKETS